MTQTRDLIKKMADFFTGEEFYEKGEDARLELSPDDVRCMNEVIKACGNSISRQVIKERMIKYGFHAPDMTVTEFVEDLPSVTPQPKTGHWIIKTEDWNKWICSECGHTERTDIHVSLGYDFCPNCGAKMVEPQEISDHKCHNCKHYTSGERDGSCGSYICKHYSNWESEDKE